MRLEERRIEGVFEVQIDVHSDARGAFARTFCAEIFGQAGLVTHWQQMNMSRTIGLGTVRGFHFQRAPKSEAKLIRATEGEVHDVVLDLRKDSPTFGQVEAMRLSAETGAAFYIPEGCAHGFQTLTDTATLHYCHSQPYAPELEGGVLATDPDLELEWPLAVILLSDRDKSLPKLQDVKPL